MILAKLHGDVENFPSLLTPEWLVNSQVELAKPGGAKLHHPVDDLIGVARVLVDTVRRVKARHHELESRAERLVDYLNTIPIVDANISFEVYRDRIAAWTPKINSMLDGIDIVLRELRRNVSVGARSST